MPKKSLRFFPFVLLLLNLSLARAGERAWPEMVYEGGDNKPYQLISIIDIPEESFVKFTADLLSIPEVCKLYENGEPYDRERATRLRNRITPRTQEWFKGNNMYLPWSIIKSMDENLLIGFLGVHLHTNDKLKEYKGVEICYALLPAYQGKGIVTGAFETYARTFSPQLKTLKEQFNRILGPISPRNFPSLNLALQLGFNFGKETVDAPYISGYFPNYISNEEESRLLKIAQQVVEKFQQTSAKELERQQVDPTITEEEWEKLKAIRVVAVMPKEIFFSKYLDSNEAT